MKKRRKKDFIVLIAEAVVIIILVFFAIMYRSDYKQKQSLKNILETKEINVVANDKISTELKYDVLQKRGLTISDIYQNEVTGLLQIRFQVLNSMPFIHAENFTKVMIYDSAGNSYDENIISFPVRSFKRYGKEYVISFMNEEIPKEETEFVFRAECSDDENASIYGKAEITFNVKSQIK